jgi:hypothetical protein
VAEALGHRTRRQRGKFAERADAEPLEHLGQRLELGTGAQKADRQRRQEIASVRRVNDDSVERPRCAGRPSPTGTRL